MAAGKNDLCLISMKLNSTGKFLLFFVPYLLLFSIISRNTLFWDTVQFAGDHPNWYFSTGFRYLLLPDQFDSGHPPTFGLFLAAVWKVFGRGLFQSHAAMVPFVALIVWQAIRTGTLLFPTQPRKALGLSILVLTQCALISQCTLVSPDIWLIGFFLLSLNGLLKKQPWQLMLGIILLGITSNRAMMAAFCLYLCSLVLIGPVENRDRGSWLKQALDRLLSFLPGALIALAYFAYHYAVKGWVGAPKDSPWAAGFEVVAPRRIVVNLLVLCWRMVDLGNIATVLSCLWLCGLWTRKKIRFPDRAARKTAQALAILSLALFLVTALPLAFYQGLLTHRYLLPLNTALALLTAFLLFHSEIKNRRSWWLILVAVQLSGHFWTYPQRVSQSWEDSLGHLYYYPMREDFRKFMKDNGIRKEEVATAGSMMQSEYRADLLTDTTSYKDFEADSGKYVWYCNAANAMNKSVSYYFKNLQVVKREKRGHVEMVLFRRPER